MSGTYTATMGDRGRLVVPSELRQRAGLHEGQPLIFVDTAQGVLMLTRSQLRDVVRDGLAGADLVNTLLAERRAAAKAEDLP